jgi:IMP dehydrogenase
MRRWTFTSFPVVDEAGKLLGLITRDEMDFVNTDDNPKLGDIMKKLDQIITAPEDTSSNEAYKIMKEKKVKKLPVVAQSGELKGKLLDTSCVCVCVCGLCVCVCCVVRVR